MSTQVLPSIILLLLTQSLANGALVQSRQDSSPVPSCDVLLDMTDAINSVFQQQEGFQQQAAKLGVNGCVGGCNGCIDYEDEQNLDILGLVDALEDVYQNYNSIGFTENVSRADFWALAYLTALENESEDQICFEYTWGRVDACSAAAGPRANTDVTYPTGCLTANTDGLYEYYSKTFSFSVLDTVALWGVEASFRIFGEFGIKYYQAMFSHYGWVQEEGENKCGWEGFVSEEYCDPRDERGEALFISNADFELIWDSRLTPNGVVQCEVQIDCHEIQKELMGNYCEKPGNGVCSLQNNGNSMYYAKVFSQNPRIWYVQLKRTTGVLLSNGASSLTSYGGTCGNEKCWQLSMSL